MGSKHSKLENQCENNSNSNFNSNEKVSLKRQARISHKGSFTQNKIKNASPSEPESDPNFSWLHDTLQGKKVLSSLTDAFYMD